MQNQRTACLIGMILMAGVMSFERASADEIVFHTVANAPLDVGLQRGELDTAATTEFRKSGTNLYRGQSQPVAEGRALYQARCQACHLPEGRGGSGPSLVTHEPLYDRVATDVGMFEIIYGGAGGAMQPFSLQGLRQDNILKIMAYVRSLQ